MARLMRVSGILLLGFLLTSCSRSLDETSSLQFDLSSLQKSSLNTANSQVSFVAINVSGSGMNRVICRYDEIEDVHRWVGPCNGSSTNPLQVEVPNVPAGDGRLIQVLAVLESTDAGGGESETFSYGEVRQGLVAGDNAVNVALQVAPAVTNMEGSASGRYLFGDGSSYTGKVALEFLPPTGSAAMEIFHLEMFAGWFEIYLLDNIPLRYRMLDSGDNHILFGGAVDQSSSHWTANNPSVMTISSPQTYYDGGNSEDGEFNVLGFWRGGVPDGTASVCYDNTSYTSDYDYIDSSETVSLSFPSHFGINGGSGTCAMNTDLVSSTNMRFDGNLVLEGHGDGLLFRGPYELFQTSKGYPDVVEAFASGTQLTVNWQYLPGVSGSTNFGGTAVFYSDTFDGNLDEEFEGAGGFYCGGLLNKGFSVVNVPPAQQTTTITTATEFANKGVVILCPLDGDGNYMSSATGTGVNMAPAVSLEITGVNGFDYPYLNDASCTAFEINARDANGNLGSLPGDGGYGNYFTVSLSAANGSFYEDPYCGTAATTLAMQNSSEKVYYKIAITPPQAVNPAVETLPGESVTLTSDSWVGLSTTISSPAASGFFIDTMPEVMNTTECLPVLVGHVDVNSVPLAAGAVTVVMNSSQGYAVHPDYDSSCMSGPNNQNDFSSPGRSYGFFWIKPNTGGAEVTDILSTTHVRDAGALTDASFNVDYVRPPDATYMIVEDMSPSLYNGACFEVKLSTYINGDGNYSPRSYPAQTLIYSIGVYNNGDNSAVSPSSVSVHDNSSCTSAVTNTSMTSSQYEKSVWVKLGVSSGNFRIDFDSDNPSDEFDGNYQINF